MYDFNSDSFGSSFGIDSFVSTLDQQEGLLGNVIITDDDFGVADKSIAKTVVATQETTTEVVSTPTPAPTQNTPVVVARGGRGGKTDQAKAIFLEFYNKSSRKDIIAMFVQKVGLTPAGASTYYQNFKKGVDAAA